ncbi:MAG: restriction endonuclease [Chloroflexi bacterium]|nr:restriction endonuclease [Chloroflexota bacterium]
MPELKTNTLYYGDNLEILRKYTPDGSVDLVYLDPPFNSKRDYNILFKENGGIESEAQVHAFTDSWDWTPSAYATYQDIILNGPQKVSQLIGALHDSIGSNPVMAYLVMMTVRLIELHRVLKPTGSLYLHCDPTMSHYIKIVLDQIFGPANYRNEITWKRRHGFTSAVHESNRFGNCTDIILFYAKCDKARFTAQYNKNSKEYKEYVEKSFTLVDEKGRHYQATSLTNPAYRPNLIYEYKGYKPPANGWMITKEKMEQWDKEGRIHFPENKNGRLRRKSYADELLGMPIQNLWDDIEQIGAHASERLGYDTQKPLALLERIIQASSNEGDVVLDPFCGCGTAVVAAQKLNRKWIGIDVTHLAINLMKNRLRDSFPGIQFEVIGEPKDLAGAKELAAQKDKYQFQWWALGLIGARPAGEKKKGADKGIDGVIPFIDDASGKSSRVIVQVKSGHVGVKDVRELETVVKNEAIGVLITLEPPTEPMKKQAIEAGYYNSPLYNKDYPKIQILTVEDLFKGDGVDMPPQKQTSIAFTRAPKVKKKEGEQLTL